MSAAVFLDKDGTLLQDLPYNTDPALIRPTRGAEDALRMLGSTDLKLFVVSNQPGVGQGRLDEKALRRLGRWLKAWFRRCGAQLAEFAWCPHVPAADGTVACVCRKPQPGLLLELARRHDINLSQSWMIGDILDDIEAGGRAGCRTILVDNGGETVWNRGPFRTPDYRVADLSAAALLAVSSVQVAAA